MGVVEPVDSRLLQFFGGWLPWSAAIPWSAGYGDNYPVSCGNTAEKTTGEDPPEGADCLDDSLPTRAQAQSCGLLEGRRIPSPCWPGFLSFFFSDNTSLVKT